MPRPSAPSKEVSRTPIDVLAASLHTGMVPLGRGFSYFSVEPMAEEDLREYLHDPIAALPPGVCDIITPVRVVLAPYLERVDPPNRRIASGTPNRRIASGTPKRGIASGTQSVPRVVHQTPSPSKRLRSAFLLDSDSTLFFAMKDENPSDYHQAFFNTLAHLLSRRVDKETQGKYAALLLEEIEHHVHGEVDEPSWERKQNLPHIDGTERPNTKTKAFREYVAQSFADTMTLYMHGICCDIDVETGPRQVPSRWLRKRLEALYQMFPPPHGRAVLPEHLTKRNQLKSSRPPERL